MVDGTHTTAKPKLGEPALYALVWVGLLALTVATYSLSRVHLGAWSVAIALTIAGIKASLVVLFFMHLWHQESSYRLVFGTALVFLLLMLAFVVADVHMRFPLANPSTLQ